ncbi:hypothetical protein BCR32DRAFT_289221 [Anaeromyces robustus]|uniref:RGS domain-containing protein n=1 Tax=Anaeromyces robustus TaxID=1754192 RepID=A0A1Y1XPH4_9FUNG|nr:hypothetical protein BCR32DRAFT_289221 [Anaeromyces robustus]|eukprot:ORX87565.1 hypothetical protein BCR32DRAFT_289221 [Anaeromyces robustus]
MIEKRTKFNTTFVNENEFKEYKERGFISYDGFKIEKTFYKVFFAVFVVFFGVSLILYYIFRKSYIIRQRGFTLSFIGGIITFLNVFIGFFPQLMKVPCALSVYNSNVLNVLVILIFFCRSLRVVLYYRYNIFKVTSVKKRELVLNSKKEEHVKEPNNYLAKIMKKINYILVAVIIIPTLISLLTTIIIHLSIEKGTCSFTEYEDAMINLKQNKGRSLFIVVQIFGGIYILISFIMTILLCFVKDVNTFGVKFECISTCILILIFNIINVILQVTASTNYDFNSSKHRRMYLDLFEITKGGKMLFIIVSIYMLFTSITLPIIHYLNARRINKKFKDEELNSKTYFNKVLNNSSLVNELRNIAIKEFSVENILFWENYKILQNMNYRHYVESKKAEEIGDISLLNQYDFEGYYQQQVQSFTTPTSIMENYSYDSNIPVPKEIIPYYKRFFDTFIDPNGSAVVNISNEVIKQIYNEIPLPSVGIFDAAKDEIVDIMYTTIYPVLLKKNEKYIKEILG